jgi:antitoxin MazE
VGKAPFQANDSASKALNDDDIHYMIYKLFLYIIEVPMQISKWGNSLAVRLPKALVDQLGLKEGDELNVVAAKPGAIEVETEAAKRQRALDNMAARKWTLPDGYRFDRDEANER